MMHRDMEVYKHSMLLVKDVYVLTKSFPKEEIYGLVSQMKRAAVSIPSNIAEGCGRRTDKELHNFLNIALGSLIELETQLEIAIMLEYVQDQTQVKHVTSEITKTKQLLLGFMRTVQKRLSESKKA
jgi:four helix bundle protein